MQITNTPLRSANADRSTHTQASRSGRLRCALRRMAAIVALLLGVSIPAMAYDYVITYTTGGTTYYLGMNGNSLQAKNTFDPTCVWTCYDGNTETTLGSTSYSLRNRNNSSYYLTTTCTRSGSWWSGYSYSWSAITVQTSANNIWRSSNATSGNVYAYNSDYQRSASIYVNNLTMHDNNTSDSKNVRVTVTTAIDDISNPTISGSDIITTTGNSNYTASGAKYKLGYVNYYFSNTDHYYDSDGNSFSGSPSNATIGTYTWSLTDNAYASLDANNPGRVVVSTLPASDLTLTLTVSTTATGGKPAAPTGTVLSATKEIIIQGSKPSAPIISISGTTVTLSTNASGSTTIRYTIDGSDPTTSSTAYSSPIDLSSSTTSPVTIKAITVRSGNASDIAEESVTLTLPAPTITINGEAKTATITSSIQGATIRYTINESDPTSTTGAVYNGQLTGLSYMANIKAIAVKEGWNDSPISSDVVTIPSGVNPSNGEVTLFDYEPHTWSYYSDTDLPDELHSLNPADIKITYNGNGTGNMTAATGAEAVDRPTSFSSNAAGVQVGPNDAANKFIYYKTLERENPDGSGDLPYTTIPNPFQVRPYGESGTFTITPTSRNITITGYGSRSDAAGSVSFTYYDENGTQQSGSVSISGTTERTTTIIAKVGTQIRFTLTRTSNNRTVYFSAAYTNGSEICNGSRNSSGSANFGPYDITAASSTISVSAYRGFYAWRVKSLSAGLTIKDAENTNTTYAANSIIPAERKILFVTSNEYNNEVVFEALWAQAYVQTGTNDLSTYVPADVPSAYERNFHVVNASTAASNFQKSYPCTVIGHAPNSSTLNNTRTITDGFTAQADTKFEDVVWNGNSGTITCNNHDVIIGRGVTTTGNYCANMVQGMPDITANVTANLTYTMRIESGKFHYFSFINGYTDDSGSTHQASNYNTYSYSGSANSIKVILGCDYDRALGENGNSNLTLTGPAIMGYRSMISNTDNRTRKTLDLTVKSGSFTTGIGNNMGTGDVQEGFYLSVAGNHTNVGERFVTIEGGVFANIAGGIDGLNNTTSSSAENWSNLGRRSLTVRMKGGKVKGAFYGGAAVSPGSGDRCMIFTGGTVEGWIGAGCNGVVSSNTTTGGQTHGVSYVYFGGRTHCGGYEGQINGGTSGDVFGAGKGSGAEDDQSSGQLTYGTNIAIADNCVVDHNVYGGGNYGFALVETNMYIFGGNVKGAVFGGANQNNGPDVNITMKGGLIEGGVYGGSNSSGKVASADIKINGGQVGTSSDPANIHGGGYGSSTKLTGNVDLTLGTQGQTTSGVTVYGDVYGGSALGSVNGGTGNTDQASDNRHTYVTLNAGTINGSLYGGALGNAGTAANVYAPVSVTVNGGSVTGAVYGCNNVNGAPQSTVNVDINGTDQPESGYALAEVYGGGNKAAYEGTPVVAIHNCDNSIGYVYGGGNATDVAGTDITVWGGNTIGYVFGGGNGAGQGNPGANVGSGGTNVKIRGGSIDHVFGGGNMKGTISGDIVVSINKQTESDHDACEMHIGEVYGGGNQAPSAAGSITVGCTGGQGEGIGDLYGGANAANITSGNIALNITGGSIERVFGGNNATGTISGNISVTVNWNTTDPCGYNYLGSVFGGGNLAKYDGTPAVSIKNGTVSGNVYGGGNGDPDDASQEPGYTGAPTVTIGDLDNASYKAVVLGDVYGGGNAAKITGSTAPYVHVVNKANTEIGYVYGGGNAADVPATNVLIEGGTIKHDVFGGGHGDKQSLGEGHSDKAANVTGASSVQVTSGIIDRVFAGSNLNGTIGGDMTLSINKSDVATTPMKIGEVYGGANMADGRAASIDIGCTGTWTTTGDKNHTNANTTDNRIGYELEGIGYVYGGANQANIGTAQTASNITVGINSGIVANVFGGNNTSGTIYGTITVNIEKDNQSCSWYVGNVFGGGNQAVYSAPNGSQNYPRVNILNGAVSGDVFGGGYGNANDATKGVVNGNPQVTINGSGASVAGGVYGGGSLAPTVGNPVVTLTTGSTTNIYGGGKAASVTGAPTVNINGGTVSTGVYGGCNTSGTVSGNITVNLTAGTIGAQNGTTNIIFGGGYGASTATEGNITVNVNGSTIHGHVYGGSAFGQVNNESSDQTTIHVLAGTVNGNIYGGGLGEAGDANKGQVNGTVTVNIGAVDNSGQDPAYSGNATINGSVYGCNNTNGSPKANVTVNVYQTAHSGSNVVDYDGDDPTYAIDQVFGGGNKADYSPTDNASRATVHIYTCNNTIRRVFGGGNAAAAYGVVTRIDGGRFDYVFGGGNGEGGNAANIGLGGTNLTVNSGVINYLFGGSNETGTINGQMRVAVNNTGCEEHIKNFFAGGNLADIGTTETNVNLSTTIACGTVFDAVYGGSNMANIYGNVTLTINGGTIGNVYAGSKGVAVGDATYPDGKAANIYGSTTLNIYAGNIVSAFGGSNINGNITGSITVNMDWTQSDCEEKSLTNLFGASNLAKYEPTSSNGNYPQLNIKHGTVTNVYGGGNGDPNATGDQIGVPGSVTSNPTIYVGDLEAGHETSHVAEITNIFGGGNAAKVNGSTAIYYRKANNTVTNIYGGGNAADVSGSTTINMSAGSVTGGLYGGCNSKGNVGVVTLSLTGGTVGTANSRADVYGGGYGSATTTSGNIGVTLNGTTVYGDLYGGSALGSVNAENAGNTTTVTLSTATLHGSVFGGGKGDNNTTATSEGNAIVNIEVYDQYLTGIYGGANVRGLVKGNINVNIKANVGSSGDGNSLDIFGGGYGAATNTNGSVTVTIGDEAGTYQPVIYGDIYGGSALGNVNDAAADITTVNFLNGTLHGNLYGGGLGDASNAAKVNGQVVVNISSSTQTVGNCHIDLRGVTIYGCNNTNGSPQDDVTVNIYKTAHLETNGGYAIDQVFGGGNQADYLPQNGDENSTKKATVHIYGCDNTIRRVFAGGNAAAATGVASIINGGRFDDVFGGGNGEVTAANIGKGGTNLVVHGGSINRLFGGSNARGTITGQMGVSIDSEGGCDDEMFITEFFCGNNLANIGTVDGEPVTINATIGCGTKFGSVYGGCNLATIYGSVNLTIEGGEMEYVYGGSKGSNNQAANITGNVHLIIKGGDIDNVFGGSNINGNIGGSITVDIVKDPNPCKWDIGNVYGASNLAAYSPTSSSGNYPEVNVKNGTINGSVYGGGKGGTAVVTSNPKVTIGDNVDAHCVIIAQNVYGGGDAAAVSGGTQVIYNDNNANSTVVKLFGGGNAANVSGATSVTLTSGNVTGGVYGGCNSTGSVGAVTVTLNGGQVGATGNGNSADVYGGGFGAATTTTGDIGVTLGNTTVYGDIYGGSAMGKVNASTSNTTTVTISGTNLHGSVFGGGMGDANTKAVSNGNAIVNINAANAYTGIYGGANVNGLVNGNIELNINANIGASGNGNSLDVFGGGYGELTQTAGNVTVNVGNGSNTPAIYGAIYGGSALGSVNDAEADVTTVNVKSGTITGNIYGGGLGQAGAGNVAKGQVNGTVIVNIGSGTVNQQTGYATSTSGSATINGSVYGCNNTNGSPKANVTVNVYQTAHNATNAASYTGNDATYAIDQVFGGGNQADYTPTSTNSRATVHIYTCNNTIRRVFGGGNAAAAYGVVTTIDGGRFDNVFGGGNGEVTAANIDAGGTNLTIHGGNINQLFGGSNASGTITGQMGVNIDNEGGCEDEMFIAEFFCGNNLANIGTAENPVDINATIGCETNFGDVYGGCNLADIYGNVTLTVVGGTMNNVYGGSKGRSSTSDPNNSEPKAANIYGNVTLNIHGGEIGNAFGGSNINGNITGSILVNVEEDDNACVWSLGNVYGASNQATYTPTAQGNSLIVNIKKGTITNNVFGGGLGSTATATASPQVNLIGGTVTGNIFGGGAQAPVSGSPVVTANYGSVTNIYGGGLGETAIVTGNPSVVISQTQGQTLTVTDVFGGGDAAAVTGNTTVTLTSGSVTRAFGGGNEAAINGNTTVTAQGATIANIYGGGNKAGATQTSVTVSGGSVTTGVYGGSNSEGTITGAIAVSITGGTIGTDATHTANVHGGGYGSATASNGNVSVTINGAGVNIWGDVYGGSALGNVNDATSDETTVTLTSGTIHGSLYGGGLGDAQNAALVNGTVNVVVNGGTVTDKVFGANNVNGTPKGAVTVTINGTDQPQSGYALAEVYGGGNQATYSPTVTTTPATVVVNGCNNKIGVVYGGGNAADVPATDVTIWGGTIGTVFGGGHGNAPSVAANVTGNVAVKIYGGTINEVFGGSNSMGNITGSSTVTIQEHQNSTCDMSITDVYGGGNQAAGNAGTLNIGCGALITGNVYGGAKEANVNNDIHLVITGGTLNNVFGGNNVSGTIAGTIIVDINQDDNCDSWHVNNVYGGGNLAAYSAPAATKDYPEVNVMNGTISGNVFGGGLGSSAVVTANPHVNVTGGTIVGSLFGGGDEASVTGNTFISINGANAAINTKVFGGGNEAGISGNTTVALTSGSVGNIAGSGIYGGCNTSGTIGGNTYVYVLGGQVGTTTYKANIHGGGYGQNTALSGDVTVNIGSVSGSGNSAVYSGAAMIYGDVYGGSALGTVNTDHHNGGTYNKTTVNLYGGTIDGNVYGGGLGSSSVAALVYGDVDVFQYGVALVARYDQFNLPSSGMIFGCNNVNGTPKGHVKVGVYQTNGIADLSQVTTDLTGSQQRSSAQNRATPTESVHTYELAAVYGGGNRAAYEPDDLTNGSTEVFVNGCDEVSIHSVYGGGNAASTPATLVTIQGAYEIEYVFGGGNGAGLIDGNPNPGANVGYRAYPSSVSGPDQKDDREGYKYGSGLAQTHIYGGRIHKVFGGSNTRGNVREATVAMLDEISSCPLELDGIYGGGKSAYMEGKAEIELGCVSGLDEIYGGAENADVGSSIVLTLTSGHYNKVYGGNNQGGKILGTITVNIEQTGCLPVEIGQLYLGGNNAPYSVYGYDDDGIIREGTRIYDDPVMNLKSFKSIGTVFGGGEGSSAELAGNPIINVNVVTGWVDGQYKGTGEQDANSIYHAAPQELTPDGEIGTIFGGGNAAKVIGNTTINIGDQSTVEMHSLAVLRDKIKKATNHKVEMGGIVFELSQDEKTIYYTINGEESHAMEKDIIQTVNGATISGNVYGGGNQASVTGGTNINVGPEGTPQTVSPDPDPNPAPIRSNPQQPQQPQSNAATESQQTRTTNATRL